MKSDQQRNIHHIRPIRSAGNLATIGDVIRTKQPDTYKRIIRDTWTGVLATR